MSLSNKVRAPGPLGPMGVMVEVKNHLGTDIHVQVSYREGKLTFELWPQYVQRDSGLVLAKPEGL